MNQRRYILYATLILLSGSGIYFTIQKFAKNRNVANIPTVINYVKPKIKMTESQLNSEMCYLSRCVSCHGKFGSYDGPELLLAGFDSKWSDKKELHALIRNHEELMKTDAHKKELKRIYKSTMKTFSDLTDVEVQSILDYIEFKLENN